MTDDDKKLSRKEKLALRRKEKMDMIHSYIEKCPRTYADLKEVFTSNLMSEATMCIVLKKLLSEGLILKKGTNGGTLYSVCDDLRFSLLAEVISSYDKNRTRTRKIAENWDTLEVKDVVEDEDEIAARVRSLTNPNDYHNVQITEESYVCDCHGYIFQNKPCTHILRLVLYSDKVHWLMNWLVEDDDRVE